MASAPPPPRPTFTSRAVRFFGHGGGAAYYLVGGMLLLVGASAALFADTVRVRLHRDVARMALEDGGEVVDAVRWGLSSTEAALVEAQASAQPAKDAPYLVVSIEERQVWLKKGEEVLFNAPVATGSGKTLVAEGSSQVYKFETPRGRLSVKSKEEKPVWTPPDWHFVEQAKKRGLSLTRIERAAGISTSDGGTVTVSGNDVVRRGPDGRETVLAAADGREIVVDGKLLIPPLGTNQRRYEGVLGTHRLNLGNGYALHGTNRPETVGQAVSHGCIRLKNEDISRLYEVVPVGTAVYIY